MKRNIFRTCVLGLGLLSLASCDDPMDELTSLIYDRVFSPIDFEARSITEALLKTASTCSGLNLTEQIPTLSKYLPTTA